MILKTYLTEQKKQNKIMLALLFITVTYFTFAFLKDSLLLVLVLLFIYMIPILVIYSVIKDAVVKKEKKLKAMSGSFNEVVHLFASKTNRMHRRPQTEWIVFPYCFLWMYLIFEFVSNKSTVILYVVLTLIITIFFYYLLKRHNRYALIFFNSGMMINQKLYGRNELRKHQWIKLRNSDQMLELQMQDYYTSFIIAKEDVKHIEKLLIQQ